MLDKSINFETLNNFFCDLANHLRTFDETLSLIRFGSSLNYLSEENLDLDVLLLSKKKYFTQDIKSIINKLRINLIAGENVKGYRLENNNLSSLIEHFIKNQKYLHNCSIYPKFIFGPLKSFSSAKNESNVFLHFKGPMTIEDYNFFCESLPFHGYSIWQNHQVISQNFDSGLLHNCVALSKDSLMQFNKGLKNRVNQANSVFEVNKCIKKLLLNYSIYLSYIKVDNSIQIEPVDSINLDLQKSVFNNYYNQINSLKV